MYPQSSDGPLSTAKMDLAYDHIQDETYAKKDNETDTGTEKKEEQPQASLSNEVQDAYKAFSNSPWGARIGGFFSNVATQVSASTALTHHSSLHLAGPIRVHTSLQRVVRSSRGRRKGT